jgi:hypothetical protein
MAKKIHTKRKGRMTFKGAALRKHPRGKGGKHRGRMKRGY